MHSIQFRCRLLTIATLGAIALSHPLKTLSANQLEEVVVTAQKRAESLQEVPISIVSFNQDKLATLRIDELTDIGASIPGFVVNNLNNDPAAVRLFIRGIGGNSVQITQDPSVALYMDGVYIGSAFGTGFEGVDVERIEVLRGPQGTLYGRNATGGAVNVITRRASTEAFVFEQDFSAGNLGAFKSSTSLNIPISSNVAAKLNYLKSDRDGYVSNDGLGLDFGRENRNAVVFDLHMAPSDWLSADYRFERTNMDDSQRLEQVVELDPSGALAFSTDIQQWSPDRLDDVTAVRSISANDLELQSHSLHINWDLSEAVSLRSITAYRKFENEAYSDPLSTAIGNGTFYNNAPYDAVFHTDYKQFSQEFQLVGGINRFEYVAGAYLFRSEASWAVNQVSIGFPLGPNFSDTENSSEALFGQVTYTPEFLESRLHLTLGARYSAENRQANRTNINITPPMIDAEYDKDFSKFNPALTASWDLGDNANLYAKVMTGFKSGGTSMSSPNVVLYQKGFDEEEVVSYEMGYKGELLERSVRLNAAAFYTEMDGSQTSVQTGAAPSARDFLPVDGNTFQGIEIDSTLLLPAGFSFSLAYSFLKTELGEDSVTSAAGITHLVDEFPYAPEHSGTLSLDHYLALPVGELTSSIEYSYQDETFSSVNENDNTTLPSYSLLGASIAWKDIELGASLGYLDIQLWGRNLLDKEYAIVSTASWQAFGASNLTTFGDPRTYGITLSYRSRY